jgi:alkylated DNA repair dioxygenase AlkB
MDPMEPQDLRAPQPGARQDLELPDADVWILQLLEPRAAQAALERLLDELPFRQEEAHVHGARHPMPRLTCWLGDPEATYTYSGLRNEPLAWTPGAAQLRRQVEAALGAPFDSALANLYRDGNDRLGWHSDDEQELGEEPLIASLSLGATRTFRLKHRLRKDLEPVALELVSGSLLVMGGATQRCWLHAVPRRGLVREPRINLTFRQIRCRPGA